MKFLVTVISACQIIVVAAVAIRGNGASKFRVSDQAALEMGKTDTNQHDGDTDQHDADKSQENQDAADKSQENQDAADKSQENQDAADTDQHDAQEVNLDKTQKRAFSSWSTAIIYDKTDFNLLQDRFQFDQDGFNKVKEEGKHEFNKVGTDFNLLKKEGKHELNKVKKEGKHELNKVETDLNLLNRVLKEAGKDFNLLENDLKEEDKEQLIQSSSN